MIFKSTHEILASIRGRIKPDLWQRITDIPAFDPEKHSDGCSGDMCANYARIYDNLPQGIRDRFNETLPWRKCCVIHDRAYYYGGTRAEKQAADEALKQCVREMLGDDILGNLLGTAMKNTVSIGGLPYFKTSYRWGYGEDFRGTEELPAHNNDET